LNFAAPGAAALAVLSLLIVAQYLLKIRRPPLTVPSTFLWRAAAASARANTPWQRLRAEPLLLLQVLAAAMLVLALMRPFVLRAGAADADLILIVDGSVNSQFVDHGQQAIDLERSRAKSLVDNLPGNKTVSVIRLDGHPRILLAGSTDHGAIRATLDGMRSNFQQPDIAAALTLAEGLQVTGSNTRDSLILLRSARTVPPPGSEPKELMDEVFGNPLAANLGIASFAAAAQADGSISAVVRIENTGSVRQQSDIDVLADGKLQTVIHADVAGFGSAIQTALFQGPARIVEAHITSVDALAADNDAWASVAAPSRKILLVSTGDYFLSTVLGLATNASVVSTTDKSYRTASASAADVAIFDRTTPASLPSTNLLIIDPSRDILGVAVGAARPVGLLSVGDDPFGLLRYLSVSDIHVRTAHALSIPGWAHVALRDNHGPLLLEGEISNRASARVRRVVMLAFALGDSDLPLSLDFPILMSNALDWMAPATGVDTTSVHPGEFVRITFPQGATTATVTTPAGQQETISGSGTDSGGVVLFTDTQAPGPYVIRSLAGSSTRTAYFTVNTGTATTAIPNHIVSHGGQTQAGLKRGTIPFDLTSGVAVLIIGVLAAEWIVSMRKQ
jgi:Ca-activated chloride channel homolog